MSRKGDSIQFNYTEDHTRWSATYSSGSGVETTYIISGLLEKVSGVGGAFAFRHYIYAGGKPVAIFVGGGGI